jgi:hypothetical protein
MDNFAFYLYQYFLIMQGKLTCYKVGLWDTDHFYR